MKTHLSNFLLGFLFFFSSALVSQTHIGCGLSLDESKELMKRTLRSKIDYKNNLLLKSGETTWVPIKFHDVVNDNGSFGTREELIFELINDLNALFFEQEIQFFLADVSINIIANTIASNDIESLEGTIAINNAKQQFPKMLHLFVVADISSLFTFNGKYLFQQDVIVIKRGPAGLVPRVLAHEIGHYCTLLHTFNGWDNEPYDESTHGNPAPTISPGGILTENQARDGSCKNCETAGDLLCDTYADYEVSSFYVQPCNYDGSILDPCNELIQPQIDNIMNYTSGEGCSTFTNDQKGIISSNIAFRLSDGQDQSLDASLQPISTTKIVDSPSLSFPMDQEDLAYYNNVHLEWDAVPGAARYMVDVDVFNSFDVQNVRQVVDYNGLSLRDLDPNRKYYWRVYPYNDTYSGGDWSETYSFTTGDQTTSIESFEFVKNWSLLPNPVYDQDEVFINMQLRDSFEGSIRIQDISGKVIMEQDQSFALGNNSISLNTANLENGLYVVSIFTGRGINSQKLVVNK